MPDQIVRIAAWILAGIFLWAGLAKISWPPAWREALEAYQLPRGFRRLAAAIVPLLELAVPVLVLRGNSQAAAALAIGVVAGGSLMILRARLAGGDKVPCGCFGGTKPRDYRALLARNALIGLVAAVVVLSPEGPVSRRELFSHIQLVPTVFVVAGVVALWRLIRAAESLARWQR